MDILDMRLMFYFSDRAINEELLLNIGGKLQNNVIEILRNFTETDF